MQQPRDLVVVGRGRRGQQMRGKERLMPLPKKEEPPGLTSGPAAASGSCGAGAALVNLCPHWPQQVGALAEAALLSAPGVGRMTGLEALRADL